MGTNVIYTPERNHKRRAALSEEAHSSKRIRSQWDCSPSLQSDRITSPRCSHSSSPYLTNCTEDCTTTEPKASSPYDVDYDASSWNVGALRSSLDQVNVCSEARIKENNDDEKNQLSQSSDTSLKPSSDSIVEHFISSVSSGSSLKTLNFKEKPHFTFDQMQGICKRLLKQQVLSMRFEYSKKLDALLCVQQEQFDQFMQEEARTSGAEERWNYLS